MQKKFTLAVNAMLKRMRGEGRGERSRLVMLPNLFRLLYIGRLVYQKHEKIGSFHSRRVNMQLKDNESLYSNTFLVLCMQVGDAVWINIVFSCFGSCPSLLFLLLHLKKPPLEKYIGTEVLFGTK